MLCACMLSNTIPYVYKTLRITLKWQAQRARDRPQAQYSPLRTASDPDVLTSAWCLENLYSCIIDDGQ